MLNNSSQQYSQSTENLGLLSWVINVPSECVR